MRTVETPQELARRWKAEGKRFTSFDVTTEFERQAAWATRESEDRCLATLPPDHEVVLQILDHRSAGKWTTLRRDPAPDHPHI